MEIEGQNNIREKAILVGIRKQGEEKSKVEEYLAELQMLSETAGAETVIKIIQERTKPDPAFYIGKGKVEEIAELAEMNDVVLIIFDEDLSPSQIRNLERVINKKILDRSGLILDIFAKHARTSEAKTQVELAQLQYTLSRLTRAWTHLSKQYGGIGTKGPGETQIETDRRIIRNRIIKLKEKLKKIEAQQKTKSANRKNFLQISLVGYTNAGKSTLLNLMTEADVLIEDKLFATLDSTTKVYKIDKDKKALMSDTVGFIRKLPHTLVASFRSTLNVVREADLILHVVDLSNSGFREHIEVVNKTLKELKCENKRMLLVFNKVDQIEDIHIFGNLKSEFPDALFISAARAINIKELKEKICEIYEENFLMHKVKIPIENSGILSTIHNSATVLSTKYDEKFITVKFEADKKTYEQILKTLKEKGN